MPHIHAYAQPCSLFVAAQPPGSQADMDDSDNMEDLDLLEKTLDEVMLRSPISPDKAWDYYRLSFGEDHAGSSAQTTHGPDLAGNDHDRIRIEHSIQNAGIDAPPPSAPKLRESPESPGKLCRQTTESPEQGLSGLLSSPITNNVSAEREGGVNGNLAQGQSADQNRPHSGVVSRKADLSRTAGTSCVNASSLLFTTNQNIKATRPRSLATAGHSVCLPLTVEKVKAVTAGEGSIPIDIHQETFPYADEDNSQAQPDLTWYCRTPPSSFDAGYTNGATDSADFAMYRYGYTGYSDSGSRRYQGGSSGQSSSYRSPVLSQRSSFSRPTMISSISPISYGSGSRNTSYGSSSLRRSTSLGNDRPYYTRSSTEYGTGSRLYYDYSSPALGAYRNTSTASVTSTPEATKKDSVESDSSKSDISKTDTSSKSGDKNRDKDTSENVAAGKTQAVTPWYNSPSSNYYSPSKSTTDREEKSGPSAEKQTNGEGQKKTSGRFYINMNYERCYPSSRTAEQRTGTEKVMSPSEKKKTSHESTQPVNLPQDGPNGKTKVVSQLGLNNSEEKQNRYTHNRQIWSRAADSTNISSENRSYSSERRGRPEISSSEQCVVNNKTAVETKIQNIDLKVSGKVKEATGDKADTSVSDRTFKDSSSHCSQSSRGLTSTPRQTAMGANVQSTHSSESTSEEDASTNMEGRSRRHDSRDSYRNRHKSGEEDYVLTESTASFVFQNGQWVPEGGSGNSSASNNRAPERVTSAYSAPPLSSSSQSRTNSTSTTRGSEPSSRGRDIPYRSTSQSSAGSESPSKYESASSMPDSPGVSTSWYHTRGGNSERYEDRYRGRGDSKDIGSTQAQGNNTAMNLYTERMNIISGFDRDKDGERNTDKPQQTVITEKLHIPMSPPTFTVGSPKNKTRGSDSDQDSGRRQTSVDNATPSPGRRGYLGSTSDRSSEFSFDRGTKEIRSMAASAASNTPYYVTEPPEEEINRTDSNDVKTSGEDRTSQSDDNTILFIDEDNIVEVTDDKPMGAQISSSDRYARDSRHSREDSLFKSSHATVESRRGVGSRDTAKLPAGIETTTGYSDSTGRPYSGGNVNRENNTTSSAGSSQVNITGLSGPERKSQRSTENRVSGDGTDVKSPSEDTSRGGEKSSLGTNERLDTVSTAERPGPTAQLARNSSGSDSQHRDDGALDRTQDTRGFSDRGSMSNNQISERRGGIYYNENVSRRNVTGLLASDQEDRRRALALSQTETRRSGEMLQTNDRSEVRQTHAGQTATRRAAGVEVSKDGDRSRSRDVIDTVDRNRTDTEYRTETPSGDVQVSKVREDRHTHSHQDRQLQAEIKKDGREVRQSSSSKSESAQVSRVTESGDSRVSQRQERHFKSSKVTRSSRTSGSGFSRDGSLHKAIGFGSDDSDDDGWSRSGRSRDTGDGSAVSTAREVDRYTGRESDSDTELKDDEPYRETIVHENKAAEVLTNSVSRTDREGTITLAEERQRGLLDRGVTRNISEAGNISTQRVQKRQQVQSARRTASSSYSRSSGSGGGDSGTVSAEDEAVILAALIGRLEEKEVAPFSASDHLTRQASTMGSESGALVVRNTEDVEGEENAQTAEEQARAIARAKLEFQGKRHL